jgi:ribosomal protein S6
MRDYEVVYIFRPEMESEDVDSALDGYHERLDGEITAVEHWGTRQLAYEIDGERSGYYVVAQFRADPASLSGFEQALDMDEELIRHLIVLSEGEMPVPPSQRREDEEEEEEDEDEDAGDEEGDEDEEDEDDEEEDEDQEEDEDEEEDEEQEDEEEDDGEEGEDEDEEEDDDDEGEGDEDDDEDEER